MHQVILVGGGFAGLAALRRLGRARHRVHVRLVDARAGQHFLPLLPDLVGRALPAEAVVYPFAEAVRRWGGEFLQARVDHIDLEHRTLATAAGDLHADALLLAAGSVTTFHGRDDLRARSRVLDGVDDALALRAAARESPPDAWVVAGGGYTGVEVATQLCRLRRHRGVQTRVLLVERSPALCGALPATVSRYVLARVARLGIEVRLEAGVLEAGDDWVRLSGGELLHGARLVWCAGVQTPPCIQELAVGRSGQGRLVVDRCLRVRPGCYAAGDAAAVAGADGRPLRMGVQFAWSGGACAAANILRELEGRPLHPFRPWDPGYVVPLADNRGCGRVLGCPLRGRLPSLLHYVMCLVRSADRVRRRHLLRALAADFCW